MRRARFARPLTGSPLNNAECLIGSPIKCYTAPQSPAPDPVEIMNLAQRESVLLVQKTFGTRDAGMRSGWHSAGKDMQLTLRARLWGRKNAFGTHFSRSLIGSRIFFA